LPRIEQRSYFKVDDTKNSRFIWNLEFDLSIRKLEAHRYDAIAPDCTQLAATKAAGMLDEEEALRCRGSGRG
jgi:hypothetical protein